MVIMEAPAFPEFFYSCRLRLKVLSFTFAGLLPADKAGLFSPSYPWFAISTSLRQRGTQ